MIGNRNNSNGESNGLGMRETTSEEDIGQSKNHWVEGKRNGCNEQNQKMIYGIGCIITEYNNGN